MKILPKDFCLLAPIELFIALEDFDKRQTEAEKFEMEKMRLQTFVLYNLPLSKADKIHDIRKFMPFSWDEFDIHVPDEKEWEEIDKLVKKEWERKQSMN